MPYCHENPDPSCEICKRYFAVPPDLAFRSFIDKVPAFVPRTGDEIGRKVAHSPRQQCIHLGKVVERSIGQCPQKCQYQCDAGRGLVRPAFECRACHSEPGSPYQADHPHAEDEQSYPASILITGGIGDAIALESMIPIDMRERLDTIYYAAPAHREIRQIFLKEEYPNLKNHLSLPSGHKTYYSKTEVEKDHGPLPPGTKDWSILSIFGQERLFVGSSLLKRQVCDSWFPEFTYVVVVPHSTWGTGPSHTGRSFDDADWKMLFDFLESHDLYGVVLCRERLPIPSHNLLVDLQAETTFLKSVEILKAAKGYLGIDSCMSVLATQIFSANRLSIKMRNKHGLNWRHIYYAPHIEFSFVHPVLEAPKWN